jgi:hypothetical protein
MNGAPPETTSRYINIISSYVKSADRLVDACHNGTSEKVGVLREPLNKEEMVEVLAQPESNSSSAGNPINSM